jgi:hypothetical protein
MESLQVSADLLSHDHPTGSLGRQPAEQNIEQSGVGGFDDRSVTRPDRGNIIEQYDPATKLYELPFRLSESNNATGDTDLSHNWVPQHLWASRGQGNGSGAKVDHRWLATP